MRDWGVLFTSSEGSGVYPDRGDARPAAIKKAAAAGKLEYCEVDLKATKSKEELLDRIAIALSFPEYFGYNWDALYDCLTDMAWKKAGGFVILLKGFSRFSERRPEDAEAAIDIFTATSQYWKKQGTPFYIILS